MDQRMMALARANEVKDFRAAVRRQLKARELHIADVVEDPPAECRKVPALDLLGWAPRVGSYRAQIILKDLVFGVHTPIGQIDQRRRHELARRLRERVA